MSYTGCELQATHFDSIPSEYTAQWLYADPPISGSCLVAIDTCEVQILTGGHLLHNMLKYDFGCGKGYDHSDGPCWLHNFFLQHCPRWGALRTTVPWVSTHELLFAPGI